MAGKRHCAGAPKSATEAVWALFFKEIEARLSTFKHCGVGVTRRRFRDQGFDPATRKLANKTQEHTTAEKKNPKKPATFMKTDEDHYPAGWPQTRALRSCLKDT